MDTAEELESVEALEREEIERLRLELELERRRSRRARRRGEPSTAHAAFVLAKGLFALLPSVLAVASKLPREPDPEPNG